jgi:hypothetical protein
MVKKIIFGVQLAWLCSLVCGIHTGFRKVSEGELDELS